MSLCKFSLLLLLLPPAALHAQEFSVTVVAVTDGDTLTVVPSGASPDQPPVRVRLSAIDCPERNQPFGLPARDRVIDLTLGQTVTVVGESTDRYRRLVAWVVLSDGRNLNHEMVAAGLAWWYRQYARYNRTLEALQSEARDHRRGLWSADDATAPWDWRKQRRRPQPAR